MPGNADIEWVKTLYRYPDEHVLEGRLRESETNLRRDDGIAGIEDTVITTARVNFGTALSRMKVLRASFEAAHQRQELERRIFREQISRTRRELLTAYRTHRSLVKKIVAGHSAPSA